MQRSKKYSQKINYCFSTIRNNVAFDFVHKHIGLNISVTTEYIKYFKIKNKIFQYL